MSFDIDDLMRIDKTGKGYVSIIRLTDIQDKPKLFSTFMLSLLAGVTIVVVPATIFLVFVSQKDKVTRQ